MTKRTQSNKDKTVDIVTDDMCAVAHVAYIWMLQD